MVTRSEEKKAITQRAIKRISWIKPFETLILHTTTGLVISGLATFLTVVMDASYRGFNQIVSRYLVWVGGVLILMALIWLFANSLRKETAKTSELKQKVAAAFIRGLEASAFNPQKTKKDADEQPAN